METEKENTTPSPGKGTWAKSFSAVLQEDKWYVADSDSEDVAAMEKEEDDEIDAEEDPKCPTIPFIAAEKIKWRREWRSALVVKGLGRRVSYIPLARRLNFLWARNGEIRISDMKNGCFLVRFRNQKDYEWAMEGGPWLLGDTYLTVHRWFKGFNPWKTVITTTMVWAQLPELPIEFINKEAVMKIGQWLGKPVRVDRATELGARGKFARLCVEVDLTQPLLSQYKIEGTTYLIQYEGLDDLCTNCGTYGKSGGKCQCDLAEKAMETEGVQADEVEKVEDPTQGRTYGDWMVVKRRDRRPGRGVGRGKELRNGQGDSNRFNTLAGVANQVETEDVTEVVAEGDMGNTKEKQMAPQSPEGNTSHAEDHAHHVKDRRQEQNVKESNAKPGTPKPKAIPAGRKETAASKTQGISAGKGLTSGVQGIKGDGKKPWQKKESNKSAEIRKEAGGTSTQKTAEGAGNRSPSVDK
ncbi:unnamed protein product [Linum trigynum]|uniref:DUF4283 domain-containing protein n=1 Tax=Linum trigynum TaxID=586398 RepID=A0AAV2CJG7_9ROSI